MTYSALTPRQAAGFTIKTLILVVVGALLLRRAREAILLNHVLYACATVDVAEWVPGRRSHLGYVYRVGDRCYRKDVYDRYGMLDPPYQKGQTLRIGYATEDPSLSRIIRVAELGSCSSAERCLHGE